MAVKKYRLGDLPYHYRLAFMESGDVEAAAFQDLLDHTKRAFIIEGLDSVHLSDDPGVSLLYCLGRLSVQLGRKIEDGDLESAWAAWGRRYIDSERNSPALELYNKLSWIGETHSFSSWPSRQEDRLLAWVEAGARIHDFPLDDRLRLLTPPFCVRLIRLREALNGWMYEDDAGDIELRSIRVPPNV